MSTNFTGPVGFSLLSIVGASSGTHGIGSSVSLSAMSMASQNWTVSAHAGSLYCDPTNGSAVQANLLINTLVTELRNKGILN